MLPQMTPEMVEVQSAFRCFAGEAEAGRLAGLCTTQGEPWSGAALKPIYGYLRTPPAAR